jgi:NAD-dependent dihydropyrimidine dehydrogenase PreA subunit
MVEETEPQERAIVVDRERCIGCFECVDICPQVRNTEYPVYIRGEDGFPQVANPDSCVACLSCEVNCRAVALRVEGAARGKVGWVGEVRAEVKRRAMF